jgi:DNA ligase-1
MANAVKTSATYQSITKSGATKYWVLSISENNGFYALYTETWTTKINGEHSVHKISGLTTVKPKNLGKSNETTGLEQAELEFIAQIQKKLDAGYHLEGEVSKTYTLPQLAKTLDIIKFDNYPVVLQAKLDGCRAVLTNTNFYSRKGKDFIPELFDKFHFKLPDGVMIDGELILPINYTFQETISAVKKNGELTSKLVYYVYDLFDHNHPDMLFKERYSVLHSLANHNSSLVLVANYIVNNSDELIDVHNCFVSDGYEGSIIRNNAPYTPNHRSSDLLKYKNFIDDEFLIIDVVAGNGVYYDCGIFVCRLFNNDEFSVMMSDSIKVKQEILANKDKYIGKMLKVKFQEYTNSGIPRFPVGICVRDAEIEG